jgi:xanthine dehydrogenase accessory factor
MTETAADGWPVAGGAGPGGGPDQPPDGWPVAGGTGPGGGPDQPPDGWAVLQRASELAGSGQAFALATVVWRQGPSSSQQGSRAIITATGEFHGWIGGACAQPTVVREARQVITEGTPRLLLLGSPGQFGDAVPDGMVVVPISCQSEGALEIYIEPVLPAPHLVVVGDSPMARTLAAQAQALGWRAEVIAGPDFNAAAATERSMVVVATQGHGDEEATEQAALARPAYLGLVGSRRRGAAILGYLAERGLPDDLLGRVTVPAGLDLGRIRHQEIAVAILAELVRLRASGALGVAVGRVAAGAAAAAEPGPAATAAANAAGPAAEATDPVCGMTVPAGPSSRPAEHDGQAYYFCCAGCRDAFEKEPAAYIRKESRCLSRLSSR